MKRARSSQQTAQARLTTTFTVFPRAIGQGRLADTFSRVVLTNPTDPCFQGLKLHASAFNKISGNFH
jgi:hypothetical protein